MEIQVIKPNTVRYYKENNQHIFDFGDIPLNSKAIVDYQITGENLTNIRVEAVCGCTSTAIDQNGIGKIEYKNTNQKKLFTKTLKLSYKSAGKETRTEIKIKGNVL